MYLQVRLSREAAARLPVQSSASPLNPRGHTSGLEIARYTREPAGWYGCDYRTITGISLFLPNGQDIVETDEIQEVKYFVL